MRSGTRLTVGKGKLLLTLCVVITPAESRGRKGGGGLKYSAYTSLQTYCCCERDYKTCTKKQNKVGSCGIKLCKSKLTSTTIILGLKISYEKVLKTRLLPLFILNKRWIISLDLL